MKTDDNKVKNLFDDLTDLEKNELRELVNDDKVEKELKEYTQHFTIDYKDDKGELRVKKFVYCYKFLNGPQRAEAYNRFAHRREMLTIATPSKNELDKIMIDMITENCYMSLLTEYKDHDTEPKSIKDVKIYDYDNTKVDGLFKYFNDDKDNNLTRLEECSINFLQIAGLYTPVLTMLLNESSELMEAQAKMNAIQANLINGSNLLAPELMGKTIQKILNQNGSENS